MIKFKKCVKEGNTLLKVMIKKKSTSFSTITTQFHMHHCLVHTIAKAKEP